MTGPAIHQPDAHDRIFDEARSRMAQGALVPADATSVQRTRQRQPPVREQVRDVLTQFGRGVFDALVGTVFLPVTAVQAAAGAPDLPAGPVAGAQGVARVLARSAPVRALAGLQERVLRGSEEQAGRPTTEGGRWSRLLGLGVGSALPFAAPGAAAKVGSVVERATASAAERRWLAQLDRDVAHLEDVAAAAKRSPSHPAAQMLRDVFEAPMPKPPEGISRTANVQIDNLLNGLPRGVRGRSMPPEQGAVINRIRMTDDETKQMYDNFLDSRTPSELDSWYATPHMPESPLVPYEGPFMTPPSTRMTPESFAAGLRRADARRGLPRPTFAEWSDMMRTRTAAMARRNPSLRVGDEWLGDIIARALHPGDVAPLSGTPLGMWNVLR